MVLGGRKVKLQRPRVRTRDGKEVELRNYRGLQQGELLDEAAFERMLYGVASRHYGAVDGGLPADLEGLRGLQERRECPFCPRHRGALAAVPAAADRDAAAGGVRRRHLSRRTGDPGGARGRRRRPQAGPGLARGLHRECRRDGRPTGRPGGPRLQAQQGLLFVVDGSKAIAAAVAQVFGEYALVQRCEVHYAERRIMPMCSRQGAPVAIPGCLASA